MGYEARHGWTSLMAIVEIDRLRVEFPAGRCARVAVNDVSLAINQGETMAIVGESGSGKSVLALSMMAMVPDAGRVTGGSVRYQGTDLLAADTRTLRRIRGGQIAMIFQEPMKSLNPVLSIGRQLTDPIRFHRDMGKAEALRIAASSLADVGFTQPLETVRQFPHQLSGGMQQRVMIAMALSCGAELIIADEPTTALDVITQREVLNLLASLTRQRGMALVMISHDLGVVARYADRVSVMYAGKIVESASARELYRSPRHPYTRGLLGSALRADTEGRQLNPIMGSPPDLLALPPGCAFAPRCPVVLPRCQDQVPELVSAPSDGAWPVACWRDVELSLGTPRPVTGGAT
jgi:oligopeptide transport system ATP-binding protein